MSRERLEQLRKLKRLRELKAMQEAQQQDIGVTQSMRRPDLTPMDVGLGALEAGTQFLTGAVAEPIAGGAGVLGGMLPGEQGQGADWVKGTREALTYQPRTAAGQGAVAGAGEFMQPVAEGLQATERFLGDVAYGATDSPAAAAAATAIPTAAMEALGLAGVRGAKANINAQRAAALEQARAAARAEINDPYRDLSPSNFAGRSKPARYDQDIKVSPEELEQLARQQRFEELGIPTTRSRITQEMSDFETERQLARSTDIPEADLLRDRLSDESAAFAEVTRKLADDLGIPKEAGELIKDVLYTGKAKSKEAYKNAYQELSKLTDGAGIPVSDRRIKELLNNNMEFRNVIEGLSDSEVSKLGDSLVRFGITKDPVAIEKWTQKRTQVEDGIAKSAEITPLNILNVRDFNKSLNAMVDPANPTMNKAVGMIKESASREVSDMVDAIMEVPANQRGKAGNLTLDVAQAAKRANDLFIKSKRDFEAKDLVRDLSRKKTGSFDTEFIANSQVADKLMSRGASGSIENVRKTVDLLLKEGQRGKDALGSLQSHIAMSLLNDATRAKSAKLVGGVTQWSGTNFAKAIDRIGDEKLRTLFKSNPGALRKLYKIRDAGLDANPLKDATQPSGTADKLLNSLMGSEMNRIFSAVGGLKGWLAAQTAQQAGGAMKARAQRKKLKQAMNNSPVIKQNLNNSPVIKQNFQQFKSNYPELAAALLIGQVATTGRENQND
jgi:hypothetical protein